MTSHWIDTHCHLDAAEFAADRSEVSSRAAAQGVGSIVIPAVAVHNFATVRDLAHATAGAVYALGIHPMATPAARLDDLDILESAVVAALDDPRFVAIGEIGLDFFVENLKTDAARAHQQQFYDRQLQIARRHGLPVLLHVRRSQDQVLAGLRRIAVPGGIAHAFNGSQQQATGYVERGLALGFGGAMTFTRALNIRRLAASLPEGALVLETDAPDIAPQWINGQRNSPGELPQIGQSLAELRGWTLEDTRIRTTANALAALPRLAHYLGLGSPIQTVA